MSISFLIVEDEVLTARFVQETIVREEHRVAGIVAKVPMKPVVFLRKPW